MPFGDIQVSLILLNICPLPLGKATTNITFQQILFFKKMFLILLCIIKRLTLAKDEGTIERLAFFGQARE